MIPDSIHVDAAQPAEDCPIRRDLTLLAASLDTRFLKAGTALSTAIELIDRVIGGLDGVITALDERTAGAAVEDLRRVADALTELPIRQAYRTERMASVAEISEILHEHVLEMHETLRVLNIYGMNIKIAASGEQRFVGFVDEMKAKLEVGESHLGGFMAQLHELSTAIANLQQADRLLAVESAKAVPDVPARLARDASDLSAHLGGTATLARKVAEIARSVQGRIAVALGALQVGDSTRQRLEHVVSALHLVEVRMRDEAADPAVAGHIDGLLAAQLDAAMIDFSRETEAMLASLIDLSHDTTDLLGLIAEQGEGGTRTSLSRLALDISNMEHLTKRLREAESRASSTTGIIAQTIGELSERLSGVCRIQLDVQDIATNTRLLCGRHGMIGRAVSVVAAEVDAHAIRLGRPTASVARAIVQLGAVQDEAPGPDAHDKRDMGETLADALLVVRTGCQRSEQVSTEGGEDIRRLIDVLTRTQSELAEELGAKDLMGAAARTLALRVSDRKPVETDNAIARALLTEIASLYTMASERTIHASFALGDEGQEDTPAIDVDLDDDGLF